MPPGDKAGPVCGGTRCDSHMLCAPNGRCYDPMHAKYCPTGVFCNPQSVCVPEGGCRFPGETSPRLQATAPRPTHLNLATRPVAPPTIGKATANGCPAGFQWLGGHQCGAYNVTAEFCAAQRGRYIRPNIPGAPTRCEVAASTGPSDANRTAPPPRVAATPPGTPPSKPAASPPSNAVPPDNAGPGASRLPGVPRQPPELPTMPAGCEEAKVNIDWVMTRDFAARLNYRTARQSRSPLEAVIFAQRHNPNAQATIRRCAAWSGDYAAWL